MHNYWPFCNPELPCNTTLAVVFFTIVGFSLFILWLYVSAKKTEKKKQEELESANRAWLIDNNLPDSTYRSIIQNYFKVGGQYPIGIPKIDWEEDTVILSVQKNGQTIALEVGLNKIRWIQVVGTTGPTARFIYEEALLQQEFEIAYCHYGDLESAVMNTSLKHTLRSATAIEITLSPEQYKLVHESLI